MKKLVFVVIFLLLYFCIYNVIQGKSIPQSIVSVGLPISLKIPSINVDASIEQVGLTPSRAMETPINTADVGWYKLGPRPGEKGSAVIDGHFDKEDGEASVFANLYKLKMGDKLYTKDDKGKTSTFIVREIHTYDSNYSSDVFSRSDGTYLNLITCDGVWDTVKKSYSKRLVVFAEIVSIPVNH